LRTVANNVQAELPEELVDHWFDYHFSQSAQ
jgi:hypothetical protein